MKNRHMVDLVYELVAAVSIALPGLYFEMYTCSEPPEPLEDLYIFGMVAKSVPVGGFALRGEDLEKRYPQTLLDITTFFSNAWEEAEDSVRFYPAELVVLYEMHEEGDAEWWRII
jgi:hypothetical protein